MTPQYAKGYLAGVVDGEGHISISHPRCIQIGNRDSHLIAAVEEACSVLGIAYYVGEIDHKGKPWYTLVISGQANLKKVLRVAPPETKKEALTALCAAYIRREGWGGNKKSESSISFLYLRTLTKG